MIQIFIWYLPNVEYSSIFFPMKCISACLEQLQTNKAVLLNTPKLEHSSEIICAVAQVF